MIRVNGEDQEFASRIGRCRLVRRLAIEPRGIAVAINGEIVRRSEWIDDRVRTTAMRLRS